MNILLNIGIFLLVIFVIIRKIRNIKKMKKDNWFGKQSNYFRIPYFITYTFFSILMFYALIKLILNHYL